VTDQTPGNVGASTIIGQPLPLEQMSKADAYSELATLQRIAKPTPAEYERGLQLRAFVIKPDATVLGAGVHSTDTNQVMSVIADQATQEAVANQESGIAFFQQKFGVGADFAVHAREDRAVPAVDAAFAPGERDRCMRDAEFRKYHYEGGGPRQYGLGGPDDPKFTARQWMAILNRMLISRIAT
jgi:hypothetical protein